MITIHKKISALLILTILCTILTILPQAHASSYGITIKDLEITPENPDIGDTLKIKVNYRTEGYSGADIKLYLYVDGTLEKTYTKSSTYTGTHYYTFYYDTDDLEERKHEIKIKAKIYDDSSLEDTDTLTRNIYFDEEEYIGTYTIDIEEITITPTEPHAGDTIRLTAKFYINSPYSSGNQEVKLHLYIDDTLEKTYTGNYNRGTRYHTFSYTTTDLEKGLHTAKIKTELYRNSWLRDTDSQTKIFYLDERRDANHDLDFTSINYNVPLNPDEKIPVTVTVKNNGNEDEENVKIKMILDDKTIYSAPFYLIRGHSRTKTMYIETPKTSGKYELIILAYNQNTQQQTIQYIETHGYTLSLAISPKEEAYTGDWIKVSGQARQNSEGTTKKLNIYRDDTYEKTIIPQENGDYADYVKFETPGYHKITVELENIKKDKVILIKEKQTTTEDTDDSDTTIIKTEDQQYTIIIIQEGKERIYIESQKDTETTQKLNTLSEELDNTNKNIHTTNEKIETTNEKLDVTNEKIDTIENELKDINVNIEENNRNTGTNFEKIKNAIDTLGEKIANATSAKQKEDEDNSFRYVDIETSNKQLVVSNFGSNIVTITITNYLGSKNTFSIDTDFREDWVFLPSPETLENKETKKLYIYFNPTNAKGEYKGNITIYKGNETIKKIPLTLYVSDIQKPRAAEEKKEDTYTDFIGPKTTGGIIFLLALFTIVMILLYYRSTGYRSEEKRPLEPKLIPTYIGHAKKESPAGNIMGRNLLAGTTKNKEVTDMIPQILSRMKEKIPTQIHTKPKGKQVYHVPWDHVIM